MITEEAFVDFRCPYCKETVSFPAQTAGSLQPCPNCTEAFIVPSDPHKEDGRVPHLLQTPTLILRRVTNHDWKELLDLVLDDELRTFCSFPAYTEEGVLQWLESDRHVKLTTPNETLWLGIELRESKRIIGLIGVLISQQEPRQAQLQTFVLARAHQGKGYGLEALEAILGFCFETINLHRVFAACDHRDVAALKLLERIGLRREGEFVKDRWLGGEWANTVWFAALREEYCDTIEASS